jgi:cytochrome c oxidase subunit 2
MNFLAFDLPFVPPQASDQAWQVDAIFWSLTALSGLMVIGLFLVITFFLIRYRSTSNADRTMSDLPSTYAEITWTAIPMLTFIGLFIWGAIVFARASKPPAGALRIYVVGVQWYWDIRHENGRREIGDLHIPVGQPVQLLMTSNDVIHDFDIPAFRVKRDVLPGKYTTEWFTATKSGRYHIFCNQYCGTKHSEMIGWLYAMEPAEYQTWLAAGGAGERNIAQDGARLFRQYGCSGCHGENSQVAAPSLRGLYGRPVPLQGGGFAMADEQYLRDSILNPDAQVVAGFRPIMPSFKGQISEPDLMAIIAYLKSLGQGASSTAETSKPPPASP